MKRIKELRVPNNMRAAAELVALMRTDDDPEVREAAADALGVIRASEAIDGLMSAARDDRVLVVRHAAMKAIGAIGDPAAAPGIIDMWRTHRGTDDGAIHQSGAEALVRIGRGAVPGLVAVLGDPDWRVRWMAVGTLRRLGTDGVRQDVERLAADPHPMVRSEVSLALDTLQ